MTADPSPVRSHRAPREPLAAFGARLGVGALVIAAVAVGGVINTWTPDTDRRERPFVASGRQGDTVDGRTFEATILGVRGAAKLRRSRQEHDTTGVWVLVRLRVLAIAEPTSIRYAAVRDRRGRTYHATERLTQPLTGGRTLQPGLLVEGEIAYEVPREAATGLTVLLATTSLDHRMDTMVEVPLPVDRATVDSWVAEPGPVTPADVTVIP